MRTLIAGGQVVGPAGATAMDVIIDGETITALAAPGSGLATSWAAEAERVIDASGKYVLPGGIDAHTHMEMPFGGTFSACIMISAPLPAACCMARTISPSVA